MELSVILPAYQEGANLKTILPQMVDFLAKHFKSFEILVIDTMEAMDETPIICEQYNASVKYVNREISNDYGSAIRTGIKRAEGDYIVFMDCDGSHSYQDIVRLKETQNKFNADVVIASRYMKGGKTDFLEILII